MYWQFVLISQHLESKRKIFRGTTTTDETIFHYLTKGPRDDHINFETTVQMKKIYWKFKVHYIKAIKTHFCLPSSNDIFYANFRHVPYDVL